MESEAPENAPGGSPWNRGPIGWMARNPVAANLFMFILLFGGLVMLPSIKQEVFPEFSLDLAVVSVPYPGASPEEVEQGIVLVVEEAVRGLDGVKRVSSNAYEGMGSIIVEPLLGADPDRMLADVKTAVDRIQSFPEEAETPRVSLFATRQQVISLVLYGDVDLRTLHRLTEEVRADLLADPDITQVDLKGLPPLEVSIEVSNATQQALGLTLQDIARQVQASSLELPAGALKTENGDLLVRLADRRKSGEELKDLVIRGTQTGAEVRLGDIATVTDGFQELDLEYQFNGSSALRLQAFRVGEETPTEVADAIKAHMQRLNDELPDTVRVTTWEDESLLLAERIDLLVDNAKLGLILVLGILALFLQLRLAFWVSLGIPISFLGALFLMPTTDISLNMISLFAFIITLGLVVDDAIIVGENIFEQQQKGGAKLQAAIEGARQMAVPVTFSIITTIAAFSPMLFVPGVSGKLFRILPLVVILVLVFSLLESFFILPAHLAHDAPVPRWFSRPMSRLLAPIDRLQVRVSGHLDSFKERRYRPTLITAIRYRYVTVAAGLGAFILAVGSIASGWVPFSFFPVLEGNVVTAAAKLPYGVSIEHSSRVRAELEASAARTILEVGEQDHMVGMFSLLGEGPPQGGPVPLPSDQGSHLVTVQVELVPSSDRDFLAEDFSAEWARQMRPLAALDSISFSSAVGPGAGSVVDVQLSHADAGTLKAASKELADLLETFSSITNITDSNDIGKPQLNVKLRPEAASLGLNSLDVAQQVRASVYGAEALREQRDRNEVQVRVRLPREERESAWALDRIHVRTPAGSWAPVTSVADVSYDSSPPYIGREAGKRRVNVTADLAPGARSAQDVLGVLESRYLPELAEAYPGLSAEFAGEQREQSETNQALGRSYVIALFVMYALLAIPFRSYIQPLVVLGAIPMGFVGAVLGHLLMGYELSIISMFGVVALSGVVINDSLVLIDSTNRFRRQGASALDAITWGGARRLRPILLTSLTTFFGLAPMILETSVQARFLIPMAISLGFGVLFSTGVILVMVPALYMIVHDVTELTRSKPAEPTPS